MEEEDDNKRNQTDNETMSNNVEVSIGGGGFSVPFPKDNCNGGIDYAIRGGLLIDSQSSSDAVNEDGNENSTPGIHELHKNNDKRILIAVEGEDVCVGSPRENRRINIGDNEDNNKDDTMILLRIQGAHLRRFDKYKKRLHLTTSLYGTIARNAMHL